MIKQVNDIPTEGTNQHTQLTYKEKDQLEGVAKDRCGNTRHYLSICRYCRRDNGNSGIRKGLSMCP